MTFLGPIPGPDLKARLDLCLLFFQERGSNIPTIVSGGTPQSYGSSGAKAEGLVMRDYLVERGVHPGYIYVEQTAYHTLDNLIESKAIMDKYFLQPHKLVIVTHDWHMARAKALAQKIFEDTKIESIIYKEVVTTLETQETIERRKKETQLVSNWVPRILCEYKDHPQFPRLPY
eukprot:TRINITY_DN3326_c0_g1_i5.p1 TRINITY_DN3326_c0_g1~~TRINITY_DN3326_c0_g1_i5.p1  ORF type:complete len:174 (-),score=31.38 TRINITY_DN3326_c0_g1_i5:163-684(-)